MNLSKADFPLQCGWDSINQLKVLRKQRLTFPEQKGILPADSLSLQTAGLLIRFWIHQAPHNRVSQFLKIRFSPNTHIDAHTQTHTHTHTDTHTHTALFVWRILTDTGLPELLTAYFKYHLDIHQACLG